MAVQSVVQSVVQNNWSDWFLYSGSSHLVGQLPVLCGLSWKEDVLLYLLSFGISDLLKYKVGQSCWSFSGEPYLVVRSCQAFLWDIGRWLFLWPNWWAIEWSISGHYPGVPTCSPLLLTDHHWWAKSSADHLPNHWWAINR